MKSKNKLSFGLFVCSHRIFLITLFLFGCSKDPSVVPPVVPPVTKPGVPTNIQATAGDASATISFSEPSNNGGVPIINYIVNSTPGNYTAIGVKSPIIITGLSNGTSYTFTVTAINSVGSGNPSGASNVIVPQKATVPPKNCQIVSISNYDGSNKSDFAMTVYYDSDSRPSKMILYDSVRNALLKESVFTYQADVIYISKDEQLTFDTTTRYIRKYITKEDLANPKSNDLIFEYIYNDSGYLATKNQYINGSNLPAYKTSYIYDSGNNLISCLMFAVSGNKKVLESTIIYDETVATKEFIYPFADGFENFIYTPIFNFGKKSKYPIKSLQTKIYDPISGLILDTWITSFGSYSLNLDGYITQLTQTGDFQQGLGMLFGKTIFEYVCK